MDSAKTEDSIADSLHSWVLFLQYHYQWSMTTKHEQSLGLSTLIGVCGNPTALNPGLGSNKLSDRSMRAHMHISNGTRRIIVQFSRGVNWRCGMWFKVGTIVVVVVISIDPCSTIPPFKVLLLPMIVRICPYPRLQLYNKTH